MKKTTLLMFAVFLICNNIKLHSQVLYSENFDNLQLGDLSTDLTGATPGQGGWYVEIPSNNNMDIRVVSEPGRGNVLGFGWLNGQYATGNARLKNLSSLWNTRTSGNDIFKMEFDLYIKNINLQTTNYFLFGASVMGTGTSRLSGTYSKVEKNKVVIGGGGLIDGNNTDYNYKWVKVEIVLDYSTKKAYLHIPSLNFLFINDFDTKITPTPSVDWAIISFRLDNISHPDAVVKIDNLKLSAIPTLPTFLDVNDYISRKFNLYPNPATNLVTISNSENLSVKQIDIYNVSGKLINTQNFSSESEIQLNVEKLANGTYLLHLQTNEGIAIKKLIKK